MIGGDQDSERRRRIVTGHGRYIADLLPPGTLHAAFVRSPIASGTIESVDADAARAVPGVVGVYMHDDLRDHLLPVRVEGPGLTVQEWHPLPASRARFVGEALAVVLAENPYAAEDGADAVEIDFAPLPPITTVDEALRPGAPVLHDTAPSNVLFEIHRGGGDVDAAFAAADVVLERTFTCARQSPLPLEGRGVLASVELTTGQLVVWTSTQIPHVVRTGIAAALGRPESSVRVVTPDVGGGFGLKAGLFPEEVIVACLAARTGRPVRWIEDRRENLMASAHARGARLHFRIAADRSGRVLGADVDITTDAGAHSTFPFSASLEPASTSGNLLAAYDIPNLRVRARGIATNKCPVGPYRGVGGPVAAFATERMLDELARTLGHDRVQVRTLNLVKPEQMPHTLATGIVLDSGDYPAGLRAALDAAGYEHWLARQRESNGDTVIGIGLCSFNEHSGPGVAAYRRRGIYTIPGFDSARVEMAADGSVLVFVSSADAGQDHVQSFRLAVARALGVPISDVTVVEGDTATCPPGSGTFASRAGTAQLSAAVRAANAVRTRIESLAAGFLGVERGEVRQTEGGYETVDGSRRIGIPEIAARAHLRTNDQLLGEGSEPGLQATDYFDPTPTYPYGSHVSVVEVDTATMNVRLLRHVSFEDCGVIVNEAAVHEQIVGGVVMGLGDALFEEHVYDEEGQPLTSTLLDYLVPLSTDVPPLTLVHATTPTDRTELGSKGVAEAGTIGATAAVGVAVADALARLGHEVNALPVSPRRLFAAIAGAPPPGSPAGEAR